MKCPACSNTLSEIQAGGITVDVCRDGCGGIWFDRAELQRLDDKAEAAGESLLHVNRRAGVPIDAKAPRTCPRCAGVVMMRHCYSRRREVEIDECGGCGGIWLDDGELAVIRGQYRTEAERRKDAHRGAAEVFREHLAELESETQSDAEAFHRITKAFRFLCPPSDKSHHPSR